MTSTVNTEKLYNRYRLMLLFQSQIHPFTPTVRELQTLWSVNSTSVASAVLRRLEEHALVYTRRAGNKIYYYAKPLSLTTPPHHNKTTKGKRATES
jgi:hypothetical protein